MRQRQKKASVSKVHYVPNATRAEVLMVRTRLFEAIREAITIWGGFEKLTPETEWADLFPLEPSESSTLRPYYYPLERFQQSRAARNAAGSSSDP